MTGSCANRWSPAAIPLVFRSAQAFITNVTRFSTNEFDACAGICFIRSAEWRVPQRSGHALAACCDRPVREAVNVET